MGWEELESFLGEEKAAVEFDVALGGRRSADGKWEEAESIPPSAHAGGWGELVGRWK